MLISQSAAAMLMVRPASFGFDTQTAQTNTFQHVIGESSAAVRRHAEAEFDAFVQVLRSHDIEVVVFDDAPTPPKPNAVFPNNWLTTWSEGRVYLYPMATESRRIERNPDILSMLRERFTVSEVIDISVAEETGVILEGTGAMVFDHAHKIVYGAVSPRCNRGLFEQHAEVLGYRPIAFTAQDKQGVPIYHTNVMMGVQSTTAVVCGESIIDTAEREQVFSTLRQTGHEVVDITHNQMDQFCGNVLEVRNVRDEPFLVMSSTAYRAFTPAQKEVLARDKTLVCADIPTIEQVGGGSARCMLTEIFLPQLATG